MADKDVVRDMDIRQHSVLDDCSPCIEETMTKTPALLRTHVETIPGEVIDTDVAAMNVQFMGGARYFVTFIDEASGHVRTLHMKAEGKEAELLKCQISCVGRLSG